MSINIGPASDDDLRPKIMVVGVGGAGGNAIANMMEAKIEGVDFIVANTDANSYGPAFSAATLAFGVAQTVSPQIGGLIADSAGSFTWVFVLSAVISMVGAAAASRLP
mgnify:CR=1 FL=1